MVELKITAEMKQQTGYTL